MTVDYDAELQRHDEVLRRASRVRAGDHVLDIGCGPDVAAGLDWVRGFSCTSEILA